MTRYMETAEQLKKEVEGFLADWVAYNPKEASIQLGHIINLAVRCSPRGVQGTVRKNIVAKAVEKYCRVTMDRGHDEETGNSYNRINIKPRS